MNLSDALAFEQRYARRSGITVEWLRERGRIVIPCFCNAPGCEGWASVSRELWNDYKEYDFRPRLGNLVDTWVWPPDD